MAQLELTFPPPPAFPTPPPTPPPPTLSPVARSPATSLAEVVTRLESDPALSTRRRRDMISAMRTLSRLAGTTLDAMPASPPSLRQAFEATSPAIAGLGRGRWNNIRSLTLAALRHTGERTMARRTRQPLAANWEDLRLLLPTTHLRAGLSRLMSFCSAEGIPPQDVTGTTFERFGAALQKDSLARKPRQVHRIACQLWNQAAKEVTGWPDLVVPVPNASRRYAMFWEDFQPAFRADAEAFLIRLGGQDPFADDYAPSVRPSTVEMRRKQFLQIATAVTQSGVPVEQLTSLATLVLPENAKQVLRFFLARAGGSPTKYLHQQAILLKTIARHWVKAPDDQIHILGAFARNLAIKKTGMTDKNRARLRQFDNPANVQALLSLPARVLAEVQQKDDGHRARALRVMLALTVELLIMAPMRIDNLTGLELDRHFVQTRTGRSATTHVVIPAAETKTGAPYEAELPAGTAEFLAVYCADYRPRLASTPSRWLFPSGRGEHRSTTPFATMISEFILCETGIKMNVHLFRHLAAKLHLEAHPEDIETARRVLGHSSTTTTLRAYADLKTASAFRRYDDLIASLRGPLARPGRRLPRSQTGAAA